MLTVNLLPWRECALARKKRIELAVSLSIIGFAVFVCLIGYSYSMHTLHSIQKNSLHLLHQSEKYSHQTSEPVVIDMDKIRYTQHQMHAVVQAMKWHSNIVWQAVFLKKGKILIDGYTYHVTPILSFIDACNKTYGLHFTIKKIKKNSTFEAFQFQIQATHVYAVE